MGEKRKRDPMGPGQKIANKKFTAFIFTISSQNDPASVEGIEAFKNASEKNKQVTGRRCEFFSGFVALYFMCSLIESHICSAGHLGYFAGHLGCD